MPTARAPVSQRSKRPAKGRAFPRKLLLLLVVAGVLFLFLRPYLLPSKALPAVLDEDWITVDLLPENPYSRPQIPLKQVNGVVVHYTGNPNTSAEANRSYFAGLAQSGATYASSHFIIGIDGKVIQCIPLNEIAYCSNSRNDDTISIECCHPDQSGPVLRRHLSVPGEAGALLGGWVRAEQRGCHSALRRDRKIMSVLLRNQSGGLGGV